MEFKNTGEKVKVRMEAEEGRYRWITLKSGEVVDLPKKVGLSYGFKIVKAKEDVPKKKAKAKKKSKKAKPKKKK